MSARRVVKINKRLWVTDAAGAPDYTPPDFVRVRSRADLEILAVAMSAVGRLAAIIAFESQFNVRPRA